MKLMAYYRCRFYFSDYLGCFRFRFHFFGVDGYDSMNTHTHSLNDLGVTILNDEAFAPSPFIFHFRFLLVFAESMSVSGWMDSLLLIRPGY